MLWGASKSSPRIGNSIDPWQSRCDPAVYSRSRLYSTPVSPGHHPHLCIPLATQEHQWSSRISLTRVLLKYMRYLAPIYQWLPFPELRHKSWRMLSATVDRWCWSRCTDCWSLSSRRPCAGHLSLVLRSTDDPIHSPPPTTLLLDQE